MPAKGHLILTLGVIYNPIRASIRTVNPKEEKVLDEEPRFKRQVKTFLIYKSMFRKLFYFFSFLKTK